MTSLAIPQIHQVRHGSTRPPLRSRVDTESRKSAVPLRSGHVWGWSLAHSCVGFLGEVVGLEVASSPAISMEKERGASVGSAPATC